MPFLSLRPDVGDGALVPWTIDIDHMENIEVCASFAVCALAISTALCHQYDIIDMIDVGR